MIAEPLVQMPILEGDLKETNPTSILMLIKMSRKNGILKFFVEEKQAQIQIHGRFILSAASPEEILFGEYLIQEGYLDHDNIGKVLELQKRMRMALGEIVFGMGYLGTDPAALKTILNRYLREVIFRIMKWSHGRFEFHESSGEITSSLAAVDMDFIMLDNAQRLEDWKQLAGNVHSLKSALKLNRHGVQEVITLTQSEWFVLSYVNSRRTIVRILEKIGQDELRYLTVINDLLDRKILIEKQTEALRLIVPGRISSDQAGGERQFPGKFTANLLFKEIDGNKNLLELAETLSFDFDVLWENLQLLIKGQLIEILKGRREFYHMSEEM